jgi:hypothetical protein
MAGTKKKIGLWTAIILLLVAIAGCVERYISWKITEYKNPAQELEKHAETIANNESEKLNSGNGSRMSRPVFEAEPIGKDIILTGGYIPEPSLGEVGATIQDYPLGKYLLSEAQDPHVVISAVGESVSNFLKQHPGSYASQVEVIGCADGVPVVAGALYKGDLGTFKDFQYYSEDRKAFEKLDLIPGVTKLDNNYISFLRAYSALEFLASLQDLAPAKQQVSTSTTPRIGGEHRKVIIRVVIRDGLKENYSELSRPIRTLVDHLQSSRDKRSR